MKTNKSNRSKKKIYTQNVAAALVYKGLITIFPFVIRTVLIYRLGEQYAGLGSLFTSLLSILSISELGFGTAVTFSMYEPMARRDTKTINALLHLYQSIYKVVGSIIALAGIGVCPFIKHFINGSWPADINIYVLYLIYLFHTVVGYFFWGYKRSVLVADQRNDIESNINAAISIFISLMQIVSLLTVKNYYVYVIWLPCGTVLNNIVLSLWVDRHYPELRPNGNISKEKKIQIFTKVKALFLNRIGTIVLTSADNIVISAFLGLKILSYYGNYYTIIFSVISLSFVITGSITSTIANSTIEEDKNSNYRLLEKLNATVMMGSGIFFAGFFSLLQDFMVLWMGEERCLETSTVFLFCIYFLVWQSRRAVITLRDATGIWEADKYRPIVSGVVNLVVNLVLVKLIGINGVLLSTILSMLFIDIPWEMYILFRDYFKMGLRKFWIHQLKCCLMIFLMTILAVAIHGLFSVISWLNLFLCAGCIGGGCLMLLMIVFIYARKHMIFG